MLSNSAQIWSRKFSNHALARAVCPVQSVMLSHPSLADHHRQARGAHKGPRTLAKGIVCRQERGVVPVSFAPLPFAGYEMLLADGRALYWPAERTVLVADLHLEKASWHAARGAMLPPYDSRATLERLGSIVKACDARRVITLGDNFHDNSGALRLEPVAKGMLEGLIRSLDFVWITGNHDEHMARSFGGAVKSELDVGGIMLRHEARPGETGHELSGHYHPKLRIRVRNRHIARPCAVLARGRKGGGTERMILPAFGAFTGGMDAAAPEIRAALQPAEILEALVPAKGKLARFALSHLPV
jgi:DNA ligase-associated metallophosphoesterase